MKLHSALLKILVVTLGSLISLTALAETPTASKISCKLYRRGGAQVCGPVAKCDMSVKTKRVRMKGSVDQLSCGLVTDSSDVRQIYQNKRSKTVSLARLECKENEVREVGSTCEGPSITSVFQTEIAPNRVWVRTHPVSCVAPAIYPSMPQITSQISFSVVGGRVRVADQLERGCIVRRTFGEANESILR